MKKILTLLTWADVILIVVLVITTCVSYALVTGMQGEGSYAIISVGNQNVARYSLAQEQELIKIAGELGEARLQIKNGRIRMMAAPCPHKTFLGLGWKGKAGQLIACVPNRVVVRIAGPKTEEELDGTSR